MPDQRIILANDSRLLRDMLNRILGKVEHLEVVHEIQDQDNLPAALEEFEAEWVVLSLHADKDFPDWTDGFIQKHPTAKVMVFSADGSRIKTKWLESHEDDFTDISLKDLIHIFETNPK